MSEVLLYLNAVLVRNAFLRLKETDPGNKRGQERTSALMYFFSLASLLKTINTDKVSLDPTSAYSKENRRSFERIYTGYVSDHISPNIMVTNLGSVAHSDRCPADKVKANFLTTILTSSSRGTHPQEYPRRPAPLLLVGIDLYGKRWGLGIHPNWKKNILRYVDDRRSNTPWTDLMLFLFRTVSFQPIELNITSILKNISSSQFSAEIHEFISHKLDVEKRLVAQASELFGKEAAKISELDNDRILASSVQDNELNRLRLENECLRCEVERLKSCVNDLESRLELTQEKAVIKLQ